MSINYNFLTASRFSLSIAGDEYKDLIAQVQEFTHPSLTASSAAQSTPRRNVPQPGTKLQYEPVTVRILLDNEMTIYSAIHNWMVNSVKVESDVKDITLTVYNSNERPTFNIKYLDAFPTNIGPIQFASNDQNDTILFSDVTFEYSEFTF